MATTASQHCECGVTTPPGYPECFGCGRVHLTRPTVATAATHPTSATASTRENIAALYARLGSMVAVLAPMVDAQPGIDVDLNLIEEHH